MDPTLQVSPALFVPVCVPARLALAGAVLTGRAPVAALVLALAFLGLSQKRVRLAEQGIKVWKDYDRLPLLGAAAVMATVTHAHPAAPLVLAAAAAGAAGWHKKVGSGLFAGAAAMALSQASGWGSPPSAAAAAMIAADALMGLSSRG
jgi:hypothetical protein